MYVLPEFGPIVSLLDSLLSELNVGLFIYHLQDEDDYRSLKLVYVNKEAERSTGLPVEERLGQRILDAFPPLAETEIPQAFREVVTTQKSRRINLSYDENGDSGEYSVRAFPMPANCVGVLFERAEAQGTDG
jgi:PAS domain-containing protein